MFNAVIQRFKEAQLKAFESYLVVARFEQEALPILDPSLRATRIRKEAEVTHEFELLWRLCAAMLRLVWHRLSMWNRNSGSLKPTSKPLWLLARSPTWMPFAHR